MAEKVKVRPRTMIHYPLGEFTPAGVEVEVPLPIAEEWIARGLAEVVVPLVYRGPVDDGGVPLPQGIAPKGKRSDR